MRHIFLLVLILGWVPISLSAQKEKDMTHSNPSSTEPGPKEKIQGDFVHMVFFWLKNPESQEDRARFEESLTRLIHNSRYVASAHMGQPAGTDREVVDNSYTYSLVATFPDKETQDKYQDEPAHHTFIAECEDLWERVVVYDSILGF